MHFDKAYVIGFPEENNQRLKRFFASAQRAGVKVERFPAVKGDELNLQEWIASGYLTADFQLNMPGSLGCLLSHVTLWEKIHNDPKIHIALVCEDDAILDQDFLQRLDRINESDVPDDWGVIRLACHKITGEPVSEHLLKPPTRYVKGANAGTYCYLVKAESTLKLKALLTPYDNRKSMDILLKTRSDQYHLYVLKSPLAHEQRFRYSVRKDMNLKQKEGGFLQNLANWITAKWFR
ncbi:MAG: glycosyltransferase family 25 protein [Fidelibacterota bacterium]